MCFQLFTSLQFCERTVWITRWTLAFACVNCKQITHIHSYPYGWHLFILLRAKMYTLHTSTGYKTHGAEWSGAGVIIIMFIFASNSFWVGCRCRMWNDEQSFSPCNMSYGISNCHNFLCGCKTYQRYITTYLLGVKLLLDLDVFYWNSHFHWCIFGWRINQPGFLHIIFFLSLSHNQQSLPSRPSLTSFLRSLSLSFTLFHSFSLFAFAILSGYILRFKVLDAVYIEQRNMIQSGLYNCKDSHKPSNR